MTQAAHKPSRVDNNHMRDRYLDLQSSLRAGLGEAPTKDENFASARRTGKAVTRAVVTLDENLRSTGRAGKFNVVCDEPELLGGGGTAPTPLHYFALGLGFCMLAQLSRFAHLYDVDLQEAEIDVRLELDLRHKMNEGGSRSACEQVTMAISIESAAPPDAVSKLVEHAESVCHASQTIREPVTLVPTVVLNGAPIS